MGVLYCKLMSKDKDTFTQGKNNDERINITDRTNKPTSIQYQK
jgi:hypothetical protein